MPKFILLCVVINVIYAYIIPAMRCATMKTTSTKSSMAHFSYLCGEAENGAVDGRDDAEDDEHDADDEALLSRHVCFFQNNSFS